MACAAIESHLAIDFVGKAIALATKSDVQHTATVITDVHGKRWRYEALVGNGYVKRPYEPRVDVALRDLHVTASERDLLEAYHDSKVGVKYPKVWYLALEYLLPFLRHMRRRLYCSQAALDGMSFAGLYDRASELIKPSPGAADAAALAVECSRKRQN